MRILRLHNTQKSRGGADIQLEREGVDLVERGHEVETLYVDTAELEAETVVAYARRAARILNEQDAGITCVVGAVAGPRWISRFRELASLLSRC